MRLLIAIGLATCIGSQANAAVKIGYLSLPGELAWVQEGLTAHINRTESVSQGVIALGVDSMSPISNSIGLGVSIGIGLPAGSIEFDRTKEFVTIGGINYNDGDKLTVKLMTVPVLGHACYHRPLGTGVFALDLSMGAVLVGLDVENIDTYWIDGGSPSPYRSPGDLEFGKLTENSTDFMPLFTVQLAPCYSIGISEKDSIGLQVPLAYLAKSTWRRAEFYTRPPYAFPPDSNPMVGGTWAEDQVELPALELGGFSWGVNLVYMRKF